MGKFGDKKNIFYLLFCLLFLGIGQNSFSQHKIQGIVLDASTNQAIAFANISIQGKAKGTTTDGKGHFELLVRSKTVTKLVVSHINYKKNEIEINCDKNDSLITVYLVPKVEQIDDIVVSAALYEQPLNKLTKSATIISHKKIRDNFQSNVIDMLAAAPGFTQVWEYHSPLILRGLNSKRLVVMKDGSRRIGTFPGGYFAQDMNIYDIEKVEIIKGPGSVIYGSGAISGIVNIISHKPFGQGKTCAKIMSGYGTNNNEFLEMASVSHKNKNFGVQVNGKFRTTGNYVYGNGETAKNSNVEDRDISINTGYRFSDKHEILINASYHHGDWGKPRGFNGPTKKFTKIRNIEEGLYTNLAYVFSTKGLVEQLKLNLYCDDGKRDYYKNKYSEVTGELTSLELVHYKDFYGGGQFFTMLNLSAVNKLTFGVDGYFFQLDNPAEVIDYYNETEGWLQGYEDAGQQNIGIFINDEWQLGKNFRLVTGIRYDYAEVFEGENDTIQGRTESREALSGNLGFVYSFNENTHFSANVGKAFRMPTAEELFTEVISCKGMKKGNPELQPEYSINFDLGFRGNSFNHKLRYDLALFYNVLDDFIVETLDTENEDIDFTFENTDALIYGGELSLAYVINHVLKPSNTLYFGLGAAYVYGIDKSGDVDEPLFGIPPLKVTFDINYKGLVNAHWLTGYNMKLSMEYADEQTRVAAIPEGTEAGPWGYEPSDPHTIFNFALGLNSNALPGHPKLRFMVKNIFDTDYCPFGSYIPAMGRNFKATLSFTIN